MEHQVYSSLDDCTRFDTQGPHTTRLEEAFGKIAAAAEDAHMMRWDCCSSSELKSAMARGRPGWKPQFNSLILDDPRFFDIVMEYPRETVAVWKRPWVDPLVYADFPVEYRAFVRDGQLIGISNYYPQRPLPELDLHLDEVCRYTETLITAVPTPFL